MADYDLMTGVKKAYEAYSPANKPTAADVTGLDEALKNAGGSPVLSTAWVQLRTAMWNGYVAADGQLLKRADYPDAWAAIQASKVPVVSDADWLADPFKRGSFTTGDGATTFRIPDYNGKYAGSIGRTFFGGDGLNSAGTNGIIQGDAIRNITATFRMNVAWVNWPKPTGAVIQVGPDTVSPVKGVEGDWVEYASKFDASAVVPTAADNRPVNVTGCWAVKLFGAVQNAGSIDAMGLATQVANLDSNKLDKASVVAPMANGGVIERGSNANGEYVKFADGTMICTLPVLSGVLVNTSNIAFAGGAAGLAVNFPTTFSNTPTVSSALRLASVSIISPAGNLFFADVTGSTIGLIYLRNRPASFTQADADNTSIWVTATGRWK